jgi:hypothetical protein
VRGYSKKVVLAGKDIPGKVEKGFLASGEKGKNKLTRRSEIYSFTVENWGENMV